MSPRAVAIAVLIAVLCSSLAASVARADPASWRSEGWTKTDFSKTRIGWQEILSGGPPKDGMARS